MAYNLFVYGSLMSAEELDSMFENYDVTKVRVDGYVRDFSKEANSWGPEDEATGVLGIREREGEWCNGLIVEGVTEEELERYDDRETGYDIEPVDPERITPYNGSSEVPDEVLTAVRDWTMDEPNPHPEYCQLCVDAAASYGQPFLRDFLRSTYLFYEDE